MIFSKSGKQTDFLLRQPLNRIEAMLLAVVDHLDIEFDTDAVPLQGIPDAVVRLAREGRSIEAIKVLRVETGMWLAEAKAVVDAIPGPARGEHGDTR